MKVTVVDWDLIVSSVFVLSMNVQAIDDEVICFVDERSSD
jgi:hypothetical protein